MKLVAIEVRPAHDGEVVTASIRIERRNGDRYTTIESYSFDTREGANQRTLLLEDNERIVVEGSSDNVVKMDPSGTMAVSASSGGEGVSALSTPIPLGGKESQVGVWRVADEQDWSRTGARYRVY